MFRHLLVPLDGSRLAETALPVAEALAARLPAGLTLLHVLESGAPQFVHGDRHLSRAAEAEAYVHGAVDWMVARGVHATGSVTMQQGDVAATIAAAAGTSGADLIVIATHGRSGVRGLLYGRVAQQVLQRGDVPVLLVPSSDRGADQPFVCHTLLIPLDGSMAAERALPAAAAVAAACRATVRLTWVVPTVDTLSGERAAAARLMPTAAATLLDEEAAEAARYLERVAEELGRQGLVVTAAVERGEPVQVLLDTASRHNADLIVIATHGRSGVSAVWAGSVASRIVGAGTRPVLLVRISR